MPRCVRSRGMANRCVRSPSRSNQLVARKPESRCRAMLPQPLFHRPHAAGDRRAAQEKNPLVILPAGSVEQHGPHLPTGTDIFAANVIGHAVAERMDGLVLPGGPLGVTPFHMPYEGTISLTPDTYMRLVTEALPPRRAMARGIYSFSTGTKATSPRLPSPPKRCTANTA